MANESGFNVHDLWNEIENNRSPENLSNAYDTLLAETKNRQMSEKELQVFYFLDKRVVKK